MAKKLFRGTIAMEKELGTIVNQKGKAERTNNAQVILAKDGTELGYYIVTTYLLP